MKVILTNPNTETPCTWREKQPPGGCVTATFSDQFLVDAPLCWKCLAQAMKVRSRQVDGQPTDEAKSQAKE